MFVNFWCDHCNRNVDSSCHNCRFYLESLFYRYQALGNALLNLKNVFDDCEDISDLRIKVRLNMASAFDTALDCFDDSLILDLDEFIMDYDHDSLPDQFSLDFFDFPDQDPYVDLPI